MPKNCLKANTYRSKDQTIATLLDTGSLPRMQQYLHSAHHPPNGDGNVLPGGCVQVEARDGDDRPPGLGAVGGVHRAGDGVLEDQVVKNTHHIPVSSLPPQGFQNAHTHTRPPNPTRISFNLLSKQLGGAVPCGEALAV